MNIIGRWFLDIWKLFNWLKTRFATINRILETYCLLVSCKIEIFLPILQDFCKNLAIYSYPIISYKILAKLWMMQDVLQEIRAACNTLPGINFRLSREPIKPAFEFS